MPTHATRGARCVATLQRDVVARAFRGESSTRTLRVGARIPARRLNGHWALLWHPAEPPVSVPASAVEVVCKGGLGDTEPLEPAVTPQPAPPSKPARKPRAPGKPSKSKPRKPRRAPLPGRPTLVTAAAKFTFDTSVKPLPAPTEKFCSVLSTKRKGGPRKNCPVQITFKSGEPFLRLCTAADKPGRLVKLPQDGAKANEIARRVCASWAEHGGFDQVREPVVGLGGRPGRRR
jgi:hypothetical protein